MADEDAVKEARHIAHSSLSLFAFGDVPSLPPLLSEVASEDGRRSSGFTQKNLCPVGFRFQCCA